MSLTVDMLGSVSHSLETVAGLSIDMRGRVLVDGGFGVVISTPPELSGFAISFRVLLSILVFFAIIILFIRAAEGAQEAMGVGDFGLLAFALIRLAFVGTLASLLVYLTAVFPEYYLVVGEGGLRVVVP